MCSSLDLNLVVYEQMKGFWNNLKQMFPEQDHMSYNTWPLAMKVKATHKICTISSITVAVYTCSLYVAFNA